MADDYTFNPLPYDENSNRYGVKPKHIKRLKELLRSGTLHPQDERDIEEFLEDYENGVDRFTPKGLDPRKWMDPWYGRPPVPEHPNDNKHGVPNDLANIDPASHNASAMIAGKSGNLPVHNSGKLHGDESVGLSGRLNIKSATHAVESDILAKPQVTATNNSQEIQVPSALSQNNSVDPFPDRANNDAALPPLVRLDGQKLKPPESMYPAMSYRENEHEVWPDWAIERASKRYPDLPKQIEASRQLVPDRPEDLDDPDYFELPDNPTFKDMYRHGKWKEKKYGQA
jgi:hypothetical protein